jgi:hypothetical protein
MHQILMGAYLSVQIEVKTSFGEDALAHGQQIINAVHLREGRRKEM